MRICPNFMMRIAFLLALTFAMLISSAIATSSEPAHAQGNGTLNSYALCFDGKQYTQIPNSPSLNPAEITVECWVKFLRLAYGSGYDPNHAQFLLCKGVDTDAGAYRLLQMGTGNGSYELVFGIGQYWNSNIWAWSNVALETNRWYHIAGTYDGQQMKLYLDGTLLASSTVGRLAVGNDRPLYFSYDGQQVFPYYVTGAMDEVRIWNYARTQSEIQETMNRPPRTDTPGLVGYWRFDENVTSQDLLDSSPNANNGWLGVYSYADSYDPTRCTPGRSAPAEESTLTGVGTRSQISGAPEVILPNMGLAIATVLVFYLAATVFNSTIRENYGVIQGWRSRGSTRLRFFRTSYRKVIGGLRRVIGSKWMFSLKLIFVVVVCALIYLKLEPYFINSLRGRSLFTALALGILVATFAYEGTQVLVSGRRFGVPAEIRIYPIAIAIALIFLLISLRINFHPGLIYGFVGAYAALSISKSRGLNTKQRAITIVLGVLAILGVCVAAFFLRELVINQWGGESFARMLVEDILVAAIAIGLEGLLFSIALPFTFLDGKKILDWNFWVWFACAGLVVFAFWELIINHDKRLPEAVKSMNVHMMFGLMGIALVISGVIYLIFWLCKKRLPTYAAEKQPPMGTERGGEHDETLPMPDAQKQISPSSEEDEKQGS